MLKNCFFHLSHLFFHFLLHRRHFSVCQMVTSNLRPSSCMLQFSGSWGPTRQPRRTTRQFLESHMFWTIGECKSSTRKWSWVGRSKTSVSLDSRFSRRNGAKTSIKSNLFCLIRQQSFTFLSTTKRRYLPFVGVSN